MMTIRRSEKAETICFLSLIHLADSWEGSKLPVDFSAPKTLVSFSRLIFHIPGVP
jgi:hypothetical protein